MKFFRDRVEQNPVPLYTSVKKTQQKLYFSALCWSNQTKDHSRSVHQSCYCKCFIFTVHTELRTKDNILRNCKKCKYMILLYFLFAPF